jgi:hypothetical protein
MWEMRGRDGGEQLLEKRGCGRRASRAWSTPLHRVPPVGSRRPAASGWRRGLIGEKRQWGIEELAGGRGGAATRLGYLAYQVCLNCLG